MAVAWAFCCNKPIFIYVSNLIVVRTEAAKRCYIFLSAVRPYCCCFELPRLTFLLRYNFTRCHIKPDEGCVIVRDTVSAVFDPLFQNGELPAVRIEYLTASVINLLKRFLEKEAGVNVVHVDARFATLQQVLMISLEVVTE